MSKHVWLITGARRGMGSDIAKAALAAGHAVAATGRGPDRVSAALGQSVDLLPIRLDVVTSRTDAELRLARRSRSSVALMCWSTMRPRLAQRVDLAADLADLALDESLRGAWRERGRSALGLIRDG